MFQRHNFNVISTQLQHDFNLISTSFQAWHRYDVVMMSFFLVKTMSEIPRRCHVVLRLADVATWFQPHIHVETRSHAKNCLLGYTANYCLYAAQVIVPSATLDKVIRVSVAVPFTQTVSLTVAPVNELLTSVLCWDSRMFVHSGSVFILGRSRSETVGSVGCGMIMTDAPDLIANPEWLPPVLSVDSDLFVHSDLFSIFILSDRVPECEHDTDSHMFIVTGSEIEGSVGGSNLDARDVMSEMTESEAVPFTPTVAPVNELLTSVLCCDSKIFVHSGSAFILGRSRNETVGSDGCSMVTTDTADLMANPESLTPVLSVDSDLFVHSDSSLIFMLSGRVPECENDTDSHIFIVTGSETDDSVGGSNLDAWDVMSVMTKSEDVQFTVAVAPGNESFTFVGNTNSDLFVHSGSVLIFTSFSLPASEHDVGAHMFIVSGNKTEVSVEGACVGCTDVGAINGIEGFLTAVLCADLNPFMHSGLCILLLSAASEHNVCVNPPIITGSEGSVCCAGVGAKAVSDLTAIKEWLTTVLCAKSDTGYFVGCAGAMGLAPSTTNQDSVGLSLDLGISAVSGLPGVGKPDVTCSLYTFSSFG